MQPVIYIISHVYGREAQSVPLHPTAQYTSETLSIQKQVPTAPIKAPLSPEEMRSIRCVG